MGWETLYVLQLSFYNRYDDDNNEGNDGSNANSDHDLDYAEADYIYSSGGRRMLPDGERAMIQVCSLL